MDPSIPIIDVTSIKSAVSVWQQMLKTVRDVDVVKIADCKEDIDTLLVFAGLFSAVLTAFLVESYTLLQPDPNSEITFLLRQSIANNYTFSGGHLNSTTPFPGNPPAFSAPDWALQVNGLWFASLICSLSTASLAMLVKGWLREYLAIEWTVPQERLRAWEYRNAALAKWKVFEIASALPLLLQISLGLFFIGLCIFTAAIDKRIGRSTLPLVAGWAFFIFATTAAPLASPRCPYKVPLLKGTIKISRRYIPHSLFARASLYSLCAIHSVARGLRGLPALSDRLLDKAMEILYWFRDPFPVWRTVRLDVHVAIMTVAPIISMVFTAMVIIPAMTLDLIVLPAVIGVASALGTGIRRVSTVPPSDGREEEDIIKDTGDDTDLLLSIDGAMVNDGFLEPMWDLVQYKNPSPDILVAFAFGLIQHRASTSPGDPKTYGEICGPVDVTSLSKLAYDLVTEVVFAAFKRHVQQHSSDTSKATMPSRWAQAGLAILFSGSRFPGSPHLPFLISDSHMREEILEEIANNGGLNWLPDYSVLAMTAFLWHTAAPVPPGDARRAWETELQVRVAHASPSERQALSRIIREDLRYWMDDGLIMVPSVPHELWHYCGSVHNSATILAALEHNSTSHPALELIGDTVIHIFHLPLQSESVRRIRNDMLFSMLSPALRVLLLTVEEDKPYDEVFHQAVNLYARLLRTSRQQRSGTTGDASQYLFMTSLLSDLLPGPGVVRSALNGLWDFLKLFVTLDMHHSLSPTLRTQFAHTCLIFVCPHVFSATTSDHNTLHIWRQLAPMMREALSGENSTPQEDEQTTSLAKQALERLVLCVPWCVGQFPKELLQVLANIVSSNDRPYFVSNMGRLHEYLSTREQKAESVHAEFHTISRDMHYASEGDLEREYPSGTQSWIAEPEAFIPSTQEAAEFFEVSVDDIEPRASAEGVDAETAESWRGRSSPGNPGILAAARDSGAGIGGTNTALHDPDFAAGAGAGDGT